LLFYYVLNVGWLGGSILKRGIGTGREGGEESEREEER